MMPLKTNIIFVSLIFCVACSSWAADYVVNQGDTETISSSTNLADGDKVGNRGIVSITGSGVLNIADGVANVNPVTGVSGLDLGVVHNAGQINAAGFIRFQEGSKIGGSVISGDNIAFDGVSIISGSIEAKQLIINGKNEKDKVFKIDLTGANAGLDVDELVVNSATTIDVKTGETLVLDSLYLGGNGTSLVVSENIQVTGNYTGTSGTTIGSKFNDKGAALGTISLLGGGTKVDGENNVIDQSDIFAAKLEVGHYTANERNLDVHGDLIVLAGTAGEGNESRLLLNAAIKTKGKLTVNENGIIRVNESDQDTQIEHGYYRYNGVFLGGFELLDNAVMDTVEPDGVLAVGIGGKSTVAEQARIEGGSLSFGGVTDDDKGTGKLQTLENAGTIIADKTLTLNNIALKNGQAGRIQAEAIVLRGSSILDLSSSGQSDGGLFFEKGAGFDSTKHSLVLDIGASASILATGKTLDMTGVQIISKNVGEKGALVAEQLVFGQGGSITGPGFFDSGAKFMDGSTLYLDNTGYMKFGKQGVTFEEGATIAIKLGTNGLGPMLTDGKIVMEEGVMLEVVDGSNYAGRTRRFQILQGAKDSDFEDLTLDSLFFSLNETIDDENGGLWIEIVKVNDLVDYAESSNQRDLSQMIDKLLKENRVSENQKLLFDALMRIPSDDMFRDSLNALSGASRENAVLFSLTSPWQRSLNGIGFNRLSLELPAQVASGDSRDDAVRNDNMLGQSWRPKMPRIGKARWSPSHDLWADLYYNYTQLNDDGNAPGGHGNRGGFFAGTALPSPSKESLLGVTIGYSAAQFKAGQDKTDLGDLQLGLYGGVNLFGRNLQLRGYLGYGMQDYKHNRAVQIGQYAPLAVSGDSSGDSVSAALYLIRPMDISDRYMLKPTLGFDYESVSQDAFRETGAAVVAIDYGDVSLNRMMWRLGVTGDYKFERFEMNGRFLYGLKIAGDDSAASTHRFMAPGNDPFVIRSVNLGNYAFDLGLGGHWYLNHRRTSKLFFDYNASVAENSNSHTTSLGILWRR